MASENKKGRKDGAGLTSGQKPLPTLDSLTAMLKKKYNFQLTAEPGSTLWEDQIDDKAGLENMAEEMLEEMRRAQAQSPVQPPARQPTMTSPSRGLKKP